MAIIDVFLKADSRDRLDVPSRKRFPYLVWTNAVVLAFFIASSVLRYRSDPDHSLVFLISILVTCASFPVSLVLMRIPLLKPASYLTAIAILLNLIWLVSFLPPDGTIDLYRTAAMVMAGIMCDSLIAFEDRQVALFAVASGVLFVAYAILRFALVPGGMDAQTRTSLMVSVILVGCVDFIVYLARRHAADILNLAEAEKNRNRAKLEELRGLLRGAEDSFEIGNYLKRRADESATMFSSIQESLDRISGEARSLAEKAGRSRDANKAAVKFAESMKESVMGQNASLDETSASIHEIIATIDNIGRISKEKQAVIGGLVGELDARKGDLEDARESIARVDRTGASVTDTVGAIMDVSERVGMLAMNASIEAAHLGAAGQGFSVIAQEMRNLSEQSMESAKGIRSALEANEEAVRSASSVITGFTEEVERVIAECRDALDGIAEILNGIQEISLGNREIQEATVDLVEISKATESSVGTVVARMSESDAAIDSITAFADDLAEKAETIDREFQGIRALIDDIEETGGRNMESIKGLRANMESAGRG